MLWLYLTIFAHFIFAVVFVADKIIVKKFLSPLRYALMASGLGVLALLLIPFVDFKVVSPSVLTNTFLSGFCFVVGIYFYFKVLLKHEASWVVPLIFGVIVPITTLVVGILFLGESAGFFNILAIVFLLAGGLILPFKKQHDPWALMQIVVAGILMALELVFLKIAFSETNFISGYILSRVSSSVVALIIFLVVYWRGMVSISLKREDGLRLLSGLFGDVIIVKQILSAIGNFILAYAISVGSVVSVNGLGGLRYIFVILIVGLVAIKWPNIMDEPTGIKNIIKKIIAIILIFIGVLAILLQPMQTSGVKTWGVDFTPLYSNELGLDPKEVLNSALNDLNIKEFRLSAYWSEIEREKGSYDFSSIDWQIEDISRHDGKVVLALGERLPRWPECHIPDWAKDFPSPSVGFGRQGVSYDKAEIFQKHLLEYIEATINHYKDNKTIWAWQVENEPFLFGFGECPYVDDELIEKEIALVKRLDDSRKMIITDSGEFGLWFRAYKRADIFGTTMYRVVLGKLWPFGYFKYPLDPDFFKTKAEIMRMLFGSKPIMNIELQGEPWLEKRPPGVPIEEQLKAFSLEQFKDNIRYAKEVGFDKNYLWGVEWWYWMKTKQGHPEFWESARGVFEYNN